jgi:ABC-type polysaccharide/polyol phosphate transport system ATPase subunit
MAQKPEDSGIALSVNNVTKTFRVHQEKTNSIKGLIAARGRNRYEDFYALRDVSFQVAEGEAVGVIGHNGSGKSTLLKCMAGILQPNEGSIDVRRRMSALLELGAGFHPELSGRDNIYLNAAILGMGRREIAKRFDEIVEFSGLEGFIDSLVKTYSSGMYVRLAFAVAINVDPDLLLIDEILAVGDVTFQQKCMEKFVQFREEGRTLVLVTHDLGSVRNFCDRVVWLDNGTIQGEGPPADLVDKYTETMLQAAEPDTQVEGARRGAGDIQIDRVEMFVGGNQVVRVRTGDDVLFRLRFTAKTRVLNPVFSLKIASLGGAVITAPNTRDAEAVPAFIEGPGCVDIEMNSISLLPGPHVAHTEITGFGRQHIFDHIQNAVRFDVLAGTPNEVEGLVTVRPAWSIDGEGVADHSEMFD